jgi:hypothetical protein
VHTALLVGVVGLGALFVLGSCIAVGSTLRSLFDAVR